MDKDWSVRAAAVHSLALRNDPAVEREIAPLMEDKHQPVRLRAAAACLRLEYLRGHAPAK
jgi:HEAT repeat protein